MLEMKLLLSTLIKISKWNGSVGREGYKYSLRLQCHLRA
jgi:hypothetical protein